MGRKSKSGANSGWTASALIALSVVGAVCAYGWSIQTEKTSRQKWVQVNQPLRPTAARAVPTAPSVAPVVAPVELTPVQSPAPVAPPTAGTQVKTIFDMDQ